MAGLKFIVLITCLFLSTLNKHKTYVIIAGDISCKACVVQLHRYLSLNVKKDKLSIAFRDKGNIILNESGPAYFSQELPLARYIFLNNQALFPSKEKFPYLLTIAEGDTLKTPYDSLFLADGLNLKYLK